MALIMALGVMFALSTMVMGTIAFTLGSQRHAQHSNAGQRSYALAESALNNALATLNAAYPDAVHSYPGDRCLLRPQPQAASLPGTPVFSGDDYTVCKSVAGAPNPYLPFSTVDPSTGDTSTWWGTIRSITGLGPMWIVIAKGTTRNPSGAPGSTMSRTIMSRVPVTMPPWAGSGADIMNWIFSWADTTFDQSSSLSSPIFVNGNLTLQNTASMAGTFFVNGNLELKNTAKITGGSVSVGGKLIQSGSTGGNGNTVGTQTTPLTAAHVRGGCQWVGYTPSLQLHTPCLWSTSTVRGDNVWATTHDSVFPPASPVPPPRPTIQWNYWWLNSSPGPKWNCDAGTTPVLDNDGLTTTAPNNSLNSSAVFNLTPTTSYTCKTLRGELSWNATTKVLTTSGTIFIDGSAAVANDFGGQLVFTYNGFSTLYVSGTFALKNAILCAVKNAAGTGCDKAAWDPNTRALVVVAGGDGGLGGAMSQGNVVGAGIGIEIKSSSFQGALFADKSIHADTTAAVQGPMISVGGSVTPGQTGSLTFPHINFAPTGAPGTAPPASILERARDFGG